MSIAGSKADMQTSIFEVCYYPRKPTLISDLGDVRVTSLSGRHHLLQTGSRRTAFPQISSATLKLP